MVALVLATRLRDPRSRWWLAGLVLCWLGDGLGGQGFLILLGCFLLGHLAYLAALRPTASSSWLRRPASLLHWAVLVAGMVLVVPHADGLQVPVVVYGLVLTLMAVLATAAGPVGLVGGLLFMVSDLTLGWDIFAADLSEATSALLVIGTYVPAQVLLLLAHLHQVRNTPYPAG
ncbi:lysoplasmalogenase family protein [Ornithinimicrobium panacihumi]|uniref:lysoplasmalogenase family protein n=1 Tax=Ornithinimicrobium panacihumi TaxID=2008449 RepID=UPI003F88F801